MYPEQVNNNYEGDGVLLYGLQGTSFYKETKENKVVKQYINKSALIAEIERLMSIYNDDENIHHIAKYNILVDIPYFLDTLEVKEMNSTDTFIEKACDAYCKVCGHYAHSVPTHICRHDCRYFSDFKKYMEE